MNAENNDTKRKKRKTRKCLNEIRKRSRNGNRCVVKDSACECHGRILKGSIQNNKYLTINRLTLSMFPKAVRSETITRPVLAEISNKPNLSLNDIVKDKNASTEPNANIYIEPIIDEKQHNTPKIFQDVQVEEYVHEESLAQSNESISGSFILQSPIYREDKNETSLLNESETDHVEFSSQGKDFSMISLTHSSRKQIKVTGIRYAHQDLQITHRSARSSFDSSELNSPNDSLSIEENANIDTVVQNPMEYIRLAQTVPHDKTVSQNSSDSTDSDSNKASLLLPNTISIMSDIPEYNYYPHKLNQ